MDIKRSFRFGLRLGVLAGLGYAAAKVRKLWQAPDSPPIPAWQPPPTRDEARARPHPESPQPAPQAAGVGGPPPHSDERLREEPTTGPSAPAMEVPPKKAAPKKAAAKKAPGKKTPGKKAPAKKQAPPPRG